MIQFFSLRKSDQANLFYALEREAGSSLLSIPDLWSYRQYGKCRSQKGSFLDGFFSIKNGLKALPTFFALFPAESMLPYPCFEQPGQEEKEMDDAYAIE